jgi:hypothetical protein
MERARIAISGFIQLIQQLLNSSHRVVLQSWDGARADPFDKRRQHPQPSDFDALRRKL